MQFLVRQILPPHPLNWLGLYVFLKHFPQNHFVTSKGFSSIARIDSNVLLLYLRLCICRCFHTHKLNILFHIDDYSRELLSIEVDTCLPASRVIRVLERLKETRSLPDRLRMDNGPEFISSLLAQWCIGQGIELIFTQPGKPTQNALIERCNGSIRRELLNANIFYTLSEVRAMAEEYMEDYNNNRPHESLGYNTPKEFAGPMIM